MLLVRRACLLVKMTMRVSGLQRVLLPVPTVMVKPACLQWRQQVILVEIMMEESIHLSLMKGAKWPKGAAWRWGTNFVGHAHQDHLSGSLGM